MEKKWLFKNRRIISLAVLVGIIFMALNKLMVAGWLGQGVSQFVGVLGFDEDRFQALVRSFTQGKWSPHKVGYFLYYPFYISLHLLFIYFLFESKKVRTWLMTGVVVVIAVLLLVIATSAYFKLEGLQYASYKLFARLFGLPFILLAIEGGKVLYADIQRRLEITQNDENSDHSAN